MNREVGHKPAKSICSSSPSTRRKVSTVAYVLVSDTFGDTSFPVGALIRS